MLSGLRARVRARWVATIIALAMLFSLISTAGAATKSTVDLQFLTVSDWHAQIDPFNVANVGNFGGAAVLSTLFKQERAANPNTLTLTAGDSFGASPPLSGFFNEVPGVLAMRLMGIDADTFGNHNFDRGIAHLQSMIDLAAAPTSANTPGQPFAFVAANLKNGATALSNVAPYKIFTVGGVKVAVIGITNPEAPSLVFPGNFGPIVPTDPVPAANKARAQALAEGAKITIAITHLGVTGTDANGAASGPLIDFANNVGGFDIVFGDHTDVQYSGIHNNAIVVENRSKGLSYARVKLTVDTKTGRVSSRSATIIAPNIIGVALDPAVGAMIAPYRTQLAALLDGQIGIANNLFPRGGNVERSGEVALGNLAADAMLWRYGSQLALTNSGGLRAPLPSSYAPQNLTLRRTTAGYAPGPPYDLVIGDVYAVLPFGNSVVTRNVTGAQLWAALENGVSRITPATCTGTDGRFPQIAGFKFAFSCTAAAGSRVVSVALPDGTPIPNDASATYSFATNDFVNTGGDAYTMFRDGQGVTREVMADVLLAYIQARTPISPLIESRITKLP